MNTTYQGDVLAEETQSARIWCLGILPAIVIPVVSVYFYPTGPARFALLIVTMIGVPALAMVWSGFQYRFLRDGVDVYLGHDDPEKIVRDLDQVTGLVASGMSAGRR